MKQYFFLTILLTIVSSNVSFAMEHEFDETPEWKEMVKTLTFPPQISDTPEPQQTQSLLEILTRTQETDLQDVWVDEIIEFSHNTSEQTPVLNQQEKNVSASLPALLNVAKKTTRKRKAPKDSDLYQPPLDEPDDSYDGSDCEKKPRNRKRNSSQSTTHDPLTQIKGREKKVKDWSALITTYTLSKQSENNTTSHNQVINDGSHESLQIIQQQASNLRQINGRAKKIKPWSDLVATHSLHPKAKRKPRAKNTRIVDQTTANAESPEPLQQKVLQQTNLHKKSKSTYDKNMQKFDIK